MISVLLYSFLGLLAGSIVGLIPALGPLIAVTLCYHLLLITDPLGIMAFYVSLLISTNYMNGVTALVYGVPGDATSIPTAQSGHRLYRRGFGSHVIGSNALSSTLGVIFSTLVFLIFFSVIFEFFKFYNSIVISILMFFVLLGVLLTGKQKWPVTLLFIIMGGILAEIGVDQSTLEPFLTFNNKYLNLGIPLMSIMIGLYIVPQFFKNFSWQSIEIKHHTTDVKILPGTIKSSMIGSFVGFWCGLVPGVTNILGSYASALITKKLYKGKYSMVVSSAEAANNSGALSSLLPLLILAIPITGSEFLIYFAMLEKGFTFDIEQIKDFSIILYFIPLSAIISMFVAWRWYRVLSSVISFYSKKRNVINIVLIMFISAVVTVTSLFPLWSVISILMLSCLGICLRHHDTTPIIYGFFLTYTFFTSVERALIILFN